MFRIIPSVGIALVALVAISCSGSGEATTRAQQEKEFLSAFGFPAPSAVVEIKYQDLYNRGVMDGAYAQWMRFTYAEEVFQQILKEKSFTRHDPRMIPSLNSESEPEWWPDVGLGPAMLYSKTHEDTAVDEGFSFRAYLWHDPATGSVYFKKSHWD